VRALVPDHVRAVNEGLPAVTALVRLPPTMDALVLHHIRAALEAPLTGTALVSSPFPAASPICRRA
jgi:hypothetical protein